MRILIVGGTGFLGGATARAAITAGHDVTVMTRSGKGVADGAATLIADRTQELPDLQGQFDAVIDTCGYAPDMVSTLAHAVGNVHHVFVSSISVYDDLSEPGLDEIASASAATSEQREEAADVDPALRGTAEPYGAAYGPLKRSCEDAAIAGFGDKATLIRLGLIVGPGDYTDRFTWWIRRCDRGGALPVPDPPKRPIQLIDVEDAAQFMLHLAERGKGGTFNLTGKPITFQAMLDAIIAETKGKPDLKWTPLKTFTDAGLAPWADLPLIVPDKPTARHMLNVSTGSARAAGLTCRPLRETIQRTLQWDHAQRDTPLKCGMSAEAEQMVLKALEP
ncbi:NAD-dependent epimerase/dehydratase family protein [Yoonia sp. SDW83-1]|uniref:NAD-dependent epimerase/dehydratase family protein n=1 Tax=Yoonia sp. SDW83-1 TaxID=3366945 RepID=UPI00398C61E4